MAEKTFINNSLAILKITLFVREGENPIKEDGNVSFNLNPKETKIITFGNDENIFLNGIKLYTTFEENLFSESRSVSLKGSDLDNLLNLNNELTIKKVHSDYVISGSNSEQATDEIRAAINNPYLETALDDLTAIKAATESASLLDKKALKPHRTFRNFFRRS